MLEEIIKLREQGVSFRKIAKELDMTVGKVQYQWVKYQKTLTVGQPDTGLDQSSGPAKRVGE
ncbi:helix-turn-helix domain-containing protein [Rossellomorea sp. H39__3]